MNKRSMTFTHEGETYELMATYKASLEIADRVADPLLIAREAAREAEMSNSVLPYRPEFRFTVENVTEVLWIGMKAAGTKLKRDDVAELVFGMGLVESQDQAGNYLALIITPTAANVRDSEKGTGKGGGK